MNKVIMIKQKMEELRKKWIQIEIFRYKNWYLKNLKNKRVITNNLKIYSFLDDIDIRIEAYKEKYWEEGVKLVNHLLKSSDNYLGKYYKGR